MARTIHRVEAFVATPVRVLSYHRVAQPALDPWNLSVRKENFSQQMAVLAQHASVRVLTGSLARRRYRLARKGRANFVVTFDDGYVDNLLSALPVLEQHDVPATFFITTGTIGRDYFWWDRITELSLSSEIRGDLLLDASRRLGLISQEECEDLAAFSALARHSSLHAALAAQTIQRRYEVLDGLSSVLGQDTSDTSARPMTADELAGFARHPLVTIGAHGHSHSKLTQLPDSEMAHDVRRGADELRSLVPSPVDLFAYPHGAVNDRVVEVVRRSGFALALTTEPRPLSVFDSAWRLPRIVTNDIDGEEFARRRRLG
jgi:peptidoglycan/xylan/chitin deacetylase (PgdA/CDA1 family)